MESMTFDLNTADAMGQFTLLADDGTPRTGLAYNTANLFATMSSPFGVVTLTLEQLSSPAGGSYQAPTAFNKVRFGEVDSTNAPGVYEIHFSLDLFQFLLRRLVTFRGAAINLKTTSFEMYAGGVSVGNVNGGIPIAGLGPFPVTASATTTSVRADALIGFDGDPVVGRYLVNADQYTTAAITGFDNTTGTLTTIDQSELSVNGAWTKTPVAGNRLFITAEPATWRVQGRTLSASGNTAIATAVWAAGTRTLTSFGTLVADTAAAVWSYASRTLTSFGSLVADLIAAGGQIIVSSPVTQSGQKITVIRGDDYKNSDGRAITFSSTGWPDITGAAVHLNIENPSGTITPSGTVVTPTGTAVVRFDLTAAQTAAFLPGAFQFEVRATLTNTNIVTLARGRIAVLEDVE